MSWNIDGRRGGLAARLERLREDVKPDVVLLQEVTRREFGALEGALERAPGFEWAESGVMLSEPERGPQTRSGPAILGTGRARRRDAGQVPHELFVHAGYGAGLNEEEVDSIGWRHKTIYVDVDVDGTPVRLCSFHARPGASVGGIKQLFHRVCADWLVEHHGTMAVGVDANSPKVDHPDPAQWQPFWVGEATLIGPRPRHHLTDALYRWLNEHPDELERIRRERPDGPLAISHVLRHSGTPRRYDHLLVTDDLQVDTIDYRQPDVDGSDHVAIVADLRLP